jgi:hypothetical protein
MARDKIPVILFCFNKERRAIFGAKQPLLYNYGTPFSPHLFCEEVRRKKKKKLEFFPFLPLPRVYFPSEGKDVLWIKMEICMYIFKEKKVC